MYKSKKNGVPIHITILLLVSIFLSFTPTEDGDSSRSYLLRIICLSFVALYLFDKKKTNIYISHIFLLLSAIPLIIYLSINIAEPTISALLFPASYITSLIFAAAILSDRNLKQQLILSIKIILIAWMIVFGAQFIAYYYSGLYIDFHKILFPFSSQRIRENALFVGLGGIHLEPGTYSNWVYGTCFLSALLQRKIGTPLHHLAVTSTLLTMSAWAYIGFFFYVMAVLMESGTNPKSLLILLLLAIFGVGFYSIYNDTLVQYLLLRADMTDGSGSSKVEVYRFMQENINKWLLTGAPWSDSPCDYCVSPQDAGIITNYLFYFGFSFLIFLSVAMLKIKKVLGAPGLVLFLPIFIAKYSIWDPIVILIFFFAMMESFRFNQKIINTNEAQRIPHIEANLLATDQHIMVRLSDTAQTNMQSLYGQ